MTANLIRDAAALAGFDKIVVAEIPAAVTAEFLRNSRR
jgi:hypothetical protein